MDVKEEEILGPDIVQHWYYRAKGQALLKMLKEVPTETVLDVGAGSGYFSKLLLQDRRSASALCIDPAYQEDTDQYVDGNIIHFRREPDEIPRALTLMMDVIEHVDDDLALVQKYAAMLPPGGHVLVTVPAFDWLWSGHDEYLEHRRRYTRRRLEEVIQAAGLDVVKTRYFFALLLPIVVPIRLWDKIALKLGFCIPRSSLSRHPRWLNETLESLLAFERAVFFPVNTVAGLSVFCLARKHLSSV